MLYSAGIDHASLGQAGLHGFVVVCKITASTASAEHAGEATLLAPPNHCPSQTQHFLLHHLAQHQSQHWLQKQDLLARHRCLEVGRRHWQPAYVPSVLGQVLVLPGLLLLLAEQLPRHPNPSLSP